MLRKWATRFLQKSIGRGQNEIKSEQRFRLAIITSYASVIINIALFLVKAVIGYKFGSIALIADAIHTLSDSATSLVLIVAFWIAQKPVDKEHPYGHGRMESIAAIIVAVLLFIAGFELGKNSAMKIFTPEVGSAPLGLIIVVLITVLIKEAMALFSYALGDILESHALRADAAHHRSDVYATLIVVLAMIASRFGQHWVDGLAGLLVSIIILYTGYMIIKGPISELLGESLDANDIARIVEIAKTYTEVMGLHEILPHRYGRKRFITIHLEVSDKISISRLHQIAEGIENDIAREFYCDVITHLDPINFDHPKYREVHEYMAEIVAKETRISSFHDLRIVGDDENHFTAIFDIILEPHRTRIDREDILRRLRADFRDRYPGTKLSIIVESHYSSPVPNIIN